MLTKLPGLTTALDRLEHELRLSARIDDPLLDQVAGHLIAAGGKRLRPLLALTTASLVGATDLEDPPRDVILAGVAVELVHLASLYHDDVMDEAATRRGVASVNSQWGNLVAVVAGDFLLARAAGIAARLGCEIAELLADTLASLCAGQVREVRDCFNLDRDRTAYLESIEGKTASLIATSCRMGALTAAAPRPLVDAMTEFGHNVGMLFQLRDDILDIEASEADLGKPAGADIQRGIYTLATIEALSAPDAGPKLRQLLAGDTTSLDSRGAIELIGQSGGLAAAVDAARQYGERALVQLERLDSLAGAEPLAALANLVRELIPDHRSGNQIPS
jgi:heptaprenyl diphosphate synthase